MVRFAGLGSPAQNCPNSASPGTDEGSFFPEGILSEYFSPLEMCSDFVSAVVISLVKLEPSAVTAQN